MNEKGYALIEVVFLVAVIAVLSSIAIPKISNEFQTMQAEYLMKSLYSELRFMQAARRINSYKQQDEEIIQARNNGAYCILISSNEKKRYRLTLVYDEELRRYNLPSNFAFTDNFYIVITPIGALKEAFSGRTSGTIKLKDNSGKEYKPFIVFDSVGRIRFSNGE